MAVVAQPVEQVSELLQSLKVDTPKQANSVTQEVPPSNDEESSDASGDASAISVGTRDAASTNGVPAEGSAAGGVYYVGGAMNGYAAHGYTVYDYPQGGYEAPVVGEWDEYTRSYVVDGVEISSPGIYSDSAGSVFMPHAAGYGYASQPSYSPYTPGTPVAPTMGADGQLYGPQAFQYPSHLYGQPMSPGGGYMGSGGAMSGGEGGVSGGGEPGPPGVDGKNGGPRPGYPMALMAQHGPYSRGVLPLTIHSPGGSQDVRYEGLRAGAPSWADVTKITEGQPARAGMVGGGMHSSMGSQQFSAPGLPAQPLRRVAPLQIHIQASQQSRNPSGLASPNLGPGALARGYPPLAGVGVVNGPNGPVRGRGMGNVSVDGRTNGRGGWVVGDKGKQRGRGGGGVGSSMNGGMDPLNEQNRGPRTIRTRNQRAVPGVVRHSRGQGAGSAGNGDVASAFASREQYNKAEFVTKYEDAKFFVIKSYSEDDVHKSIKYNVWASTPVGNKRLDAAYQEAVAKCSGGTKSCPVFLFFSVNASGQFCGVAEMTGPVDFSKSVDFWQQDKWNGRFPVTWHVIKDIPNCQFRHIILENNDNKPVTNSRDTQEVKFEQGVGMLNIFKSFASKTSILDDFQFYENRQRALTEKRARQQTQQQQREQHRQGSLVLSGGTEVEEAGSTVGEVDKERHDEVGEGVGDGTCAVENAGGAVDGAHASSVETSGSGSGSGVSDVDSVSRVRSSSSEKSSMGSVAEAEAREEEQETSNIGEKEQQGGPGTGSGSGGDVVEGSSGEVEKESAVVEGGGGRGRGG